MGNRLTQALAADGVPVLRQVKISATLPDGRVVDAVADYAYKINGRIFFHEVKFGLSAKLSVNQKVVYAAISEGRVAIASKLAASKLGVGQGVLLEDATTVLEATENSRAWSQFARYVPGPRVVLKFMGSAAVTGVTLFLHTQDISHYDALMDECPACSPGASYNGE